MLRISIIIVSVICAVTISARGQVPSSSANEKPVQLAMPNSDLADVLKLYAHLTKRKVWVQLGLAAKVSVETHGVDPRAEAVWLLRKTLLASGIEIREVGDSEAFVSRTGSQ
jgi:hypothetical protein